jgi:hypothetical protein
MARLRPAKIEHDRESELQLRQARLLARCMYAFEDDRSAYPGADAIETMHPVELRRHALAFKGVGKSLAAHVIEALDRAQGRRGAR